MTDEPMKDDQLTPFSGELEFEDLEFLSDQQAEMLAGGHCFGINGGPGKRPRIKRRIKRFLKKD